MGICLAKPLPAWCGYKRVFLAGAHIPSFILAMLACNILLAVLWSTAAVVDGCSLGALRIVGSGTHGRLEVCGSNRFWGLVCQRSWDNVDAKVACRQLGLPYEAAVALSSSIRTRRSGTFVLAQVQCTGNETRLLDCPANPLGVHDCDVRFEQAGVACADSTCSYGQLRLRGGTDTCGRVEICNNNIWGTICRYSWGLRETQVACRQLEPATLFSDFDKGSGHIWPYDYFCYGRETHLTDCSRNTHIINGCHTSDAIGVSCFNPPCTTGDIRFVGGATNMSGRVEICINNVWGTVCNDLWDEANAKVVCRQLGMASIGASVLPLENVTAGCGQIWLDDVQCRGTETRLADCPASDLGTHDCSHRDDVGVLCQDDINECLMDNGGCEQTCHNILDSFLCSCEVGYVLAANGLDCDDVNECENSNGGCQHACNNTVGSFWCSCEPGYILATNLFNCEALDIRLRAVDNNGTANISTGRLEIFIHKEWGTVCSDEFDISDADVACRQLGYSQAVSFSNAMHLRYSTNLDSPIWLSGLNCSCDDDEAYLTDCSQATIGMNGCDHSNDIILSCLTEGSIRLVNSSDMPATDLLASGRLEIYLQGEWGIVCNRFPYTFTQTEAEVACRQLGFSSAARYGPAHRLGFDVANSATTAWLDDVLCGSTDAQNLLSCDYNGRMRSPACADNEAIALICGVPNHVRLVASDGVRTAGLSAGRLEVLIDNQWGTVCSSAFDAKDADVACKELGYDGMLSYTTAFTLSYPTNLHTPIWLAAQECPTGNNTELKVCPSSFIAILVDCSHGDDIVLSCIAESSTSLKSTGRLEIYLQGKWGSVCDESFSPTTADVVCGQLGFSTFTNFSQLSPTMESAPIWLSGVSCATNYQTLLDCDQRMIGCDHSADVVLTCATAQEGDVRLVGTNPQIGRLELYLDGTWRTICAADFNLLYEADLACIQLGYLNAEKVGTTESLGISSGSGPLSNIITRIECSPPHTRLIDCDRSFNESCSHSDNVAVQCSNEANIRLESSDGIRTNALSAGRLEAKIYKKWGTVCSRGFDITDANVACRQLGFNGALAFTTASELGYFTDLSSPAWLSDMNCSAIESDDVRNLRVCPRSPVRQNSCEHSQDVILSCFDEGSLRLVGSEDAPVSTLPLAGRLEMYYEGEWGAVCSTFFGENEAEVACRQLGFSRVTNFSRALDLGFNISKENTPIWLADLSCDSGAIQTLLDCDYTDIRVASGSCNHSSDVALICGVPSQMPLTTPQAQTADSQATLQAAVPQATVPTLEISLGVVFGIVALVALLVVLFSVLFLTRRKKESYDSRNLVSPALEKEHEVSGGNNLKRFTVQSTLRQNVPQSLIIPSCNLKLESTLGQGEFGVVYKGYRKRGFSETISSMVAIKTLKGIVQKDLINDLLKECKKMSDFDHPNVLTLLGVCLDGGPAPLIVMPFMMNGSLNTYLKKERENLLLNADSDFDVAPVERKLLDFCIQIAKGMEYLASKRVVHRDLAARNCMIDINFVIKVADFGLAESLDTSKEYFRDKDNAVRLPIKWLAPESIDDMIFSERSDVWSFGVTCWEVFSGGKTPYPSISPADLPQQLNKGLRLDKPFNAACSDDMYSIMTNCWVVDPNLRPAFAELVEKLSGLLEAMAGYLNMQTLDN